MRCGGISKAKSYNSIRQTLPGSFHMQVIALFSKLIEIILKTHNKLKQCQLYRVEAWWSSG